VVIGLALSSDGPRADLSGAVRAAVAAVVSSRDVRLITADDACTAAGGDVAARRLLAAGAVLVLGHPCSNAAIAAAAVYAAADVPFVAVGARHPDLTDKRAGPGVFRLGGRDDRQPVDTVAAMADRVRGRSVAVVHDRTRYARTLATDVAQGFIRAGAAGVEVTPIVGGEQNYDAVVSKILAPKPDVVYFSGFPAEAHMIARTIAARGIHPLFIFSDSISAPDRPAASGITDGPDSVQSRDFPPALDAVVMGNTATDDIPRLAARAAAFVTAWVEEVTRGAGVSLGGGEPPPNATAARSDTVGRLLRADGTGDVPWRSFAPRPFAPAGSGGGR
jgi:branched-chain amino acid transport system substrate-binding protein